MGPQIPNPNSMHLEASKFWEKPVFALLVDFPLNRRVTFMCFLSLVTIHHMTLLAVSGCF